MNVYAKARDSPEISVMVIAAHKQYHIKKDIETMVQIHQPESYWDIKLNYFQVYPLTLIRCRNGNWLHGGSSPLTWTKHND